ncbi:MAG: alpha/beta fold hydrolase [Acidobacteriia bacterium]|nr:alpha/beta fold hydrolase [Terriglobia bacterium]
MTEPKITPHEWGCVLCHPHPQFGGTMHTKAIFRSARALQSLGMVTLQFNFRGVGQSTGTFDEGRGEKDDVRAAVDFLRGRYPDARLALLGFSFGAWVGLQVGAEDDRIVQLIGLGIPFSISSFSFLNASVKLKLIIQGSRDEFGSREAIETWYETLSEPKKLVLIEGANHLFDGKIHELQKSIVEYFSEQYSMGAVNPI